ncbi:hypothetical protein HZB90_00755 [archaeon]|nr:hypothetical protein [archaeon]
MENIELEKVVEKENVKAKPGQESVSGYASRDCYSLFCEQYLERPVISEKEKLAISPTACTWRGLPTVDDF